jgi:hypothetical protein
MGGTEQIPQYPTLFVQLDLWKGNFAKSGYPQDFKYQIPVYVLYAKITQPPPSIPLAAALL